MNKLFTTLILILIFLCSNLFAASKNPLKIFKKDILGGDAKKFYKADASIDPHYSAGENRSILILSSKHVPNPLYIRYGWKNYIEGTLYNVEGLPASSFRSYNFD